MQSQNAGETLQDRMIRLWNASPRFIFLSPSILFVLFLSIFPLVASLYLSMSRIRFVKGGFEITFIGVRNYEKLLSGSQERHFLGKYGEVTPQGYAVLIILVSLMLIMLVRYCLREKIKPYGLIAASAFVVAANRFVPPLVNTLREADVSAEGLGSLYIETFLKLAVGIGIGLYIVNKLDALGVVLRVISILFATRIIWLLIRTMSEGGLNEGGLPGTIGVTMIFAFGGVFFQYIFGLMLAMLVTQNLAGKRFFRIIFLLPMMITPVGIGFLFRMVTNTVLGPIAPLWKFVGLSEVTWAETAFGARTAVMVGDIWQWTPFMFIILLAALEGVSRDQVEASLVDGANSFQIFRYIVLPHILPVSTTLILIRLIEAFKIIDMPQVLTYGGPGTATESTTLHVYNLWRAIDLGTSAALAYLLLIVVTFIALTYVNFFRRRVLENL
ncbi:MAG: sugar ABC transporter permease [Chloroflexi bacterium]|nr:sugar ABC transporter permease [Chloroflexota bacterium]